MGDEPIAKSIRIGRTAEYYPEPMIQRITELLEARGESLREAGLESGLDHQALRRIMNGQRPFMHICILLADHFEVDPNEFLELAAWPRLRAFDAHTGSFHKLPIEAVNVAYDVAKISNPETRKAVAQAIQTLLAKYFEE